MKHQLNFNSYLFSLRYVLYQIIQSIILNPVKRYQGDALVISILVERNELLLDILQR